MAYTKTVWQDLPNETTPINASNLNKIENELATLDTDVSKKLNKTVRVTTEGADCNDYVEEGMYYFAVAGTNTPPNSSYGWLEVINAGVVGRVKQIWYKVIFSFTDYHEFLIYQRSFYDDTWTSWKQIANEKPAISTAIDSTSDITISGSNVKIPLKSIVNIDNAFTINNGEIVVPSGARQLEISGNFRLYSVSPTTTTCTISVCKNSSSSSNILASGFNSGTAGININIASRITSINGGDKIILYATASSSGSFVVSKADYISNLSVKLIR